MVVDQHGTPVDAEMHDGSTEEQDISQLNEQIANRKREKRALSDHGSDTGPDVLKRAKIEEISSKVAELQNERIQTINQRNKKRKASALGPVESSHPEAVRLRSLRSYNYHFFSKSYLVIYY